MELEKELVAALRALELHEVPEDMVASLFNSGGTAVTTTSATGDVVSAGDALFPDLVGNVTVSQLRSIDRVFTKYLRKHLAAIEETEASSSVATPRSKRLSLDTSTTTDLEVAELWEFFASEEAVTSIIGEAHERAHSTAAYRTFFTLIHAVINIRDVYAALDADEKRRALAKALLASKVYLTWLQIPGGSAYGLFMPYVYRQVLDVLKKWIVLMRDDAIARAKEHGLLSTRRVSARQRTLKEKRIAATRRDNEDFTEIQHKLAKFGLDLFRMMATFLDHFSLAASTESIVPTIEMVLALQTTVPDDATGEAVTDASLNVLEKLLNGVHGSVVHLARVVVHCYVPGIVLHEPLAIENRCAVRFHRLAIDVVSRIERLVLASDASDDARHQISLLRLGLLQNVCLRAPERSEERQRVLAYAFSVAVRGRAADSSASGLQDEERVRLARFLASYSRNANAKFRQFAVELIGKCVLEPEFWHTPEDVAHELVAFSGVGPLLDVLIDRSRDKMSTVRAKAIAGISSALTLGLSSMPQLRDSDTVAVDADDKDDATEATRHRSELIAQSLQKLLYARTTDASGKATMEETPLLRRLIELFRESLSDEKTFVRRGAVQALEALLVVRPGTIQSTMRKDLVAIHAKCTDASLLVRVQAIKSLSAILLQFPRDDEVQKLWNLGVLPLCADPEATVQAASLEWTNRLVFARVLAWYDARKRTSAREALASVWQLVGHLDGVMVKCVQKALRILLKDDRVDAKKLIRACIDAIHDCVSTDDDDAASATCYWDFSWVVLEELAHTGKLVEASHVDKQNLAIVVDCWNKLQQQALPTAFNHGSTRILRVIAALAPVLPTRDSKAIADSILASLHAFTIPLNVLADAVLALNSICKARVPSDASRREISFGWGAKLLELCEANLRQCFEREPQRVVDHTMLVQKQLICVGEVALLEFTKDDDDKSRDPAEVALLPVSDSVKALVQLFLLPQIAASRPSAPSSPADGDEDDDDEQEEQEDTNQSAPTDIPTPVRVCAFVTLGKLCLRDQELAKDCITMLIRELRTCRVQEIRSNILLILGDLCIRYTSLVDAYIPTIALSLLDASALIRRSALLLFSQLILQDYIKWRESLLRFFIRAVVDPDAELANLARHVLCGPLRQKSPHLFSNKFVEMIFVFNRYDGPLHFALDRDGVDEIALPGNARFPQRFQLYRFLLQNMSDEQKLQISMKLCNEVLDEVTDGKLPLAPTPAQITETGTEAVLKDTFAILCSSDIKLSTTRDGDDDADGDDAVDTDASVATQLAAAKGKLLSKMSKKNFLENVVPVLIGLKHKLESKRSPLMRYLQHYFHELFKLYRQEVKDILSADPQMAMEVEYDMRQFELHHKKQLESQQQQLHRAVGAATAPQPSPTAASVNGTGAPATPPKTPSPTRLPTTTPYQMLEVSETPVLDAPDSAVRLRDDVHVHGANAKKLAARRRRRRRSLPPVESPLRVLEQRTTSRVESDSDGDGVVSARVMLFSPTKGASSGGDAAPGGSWQVAARSPTVSGKSKSKDRASKRATTAFTQEDLEQSMQQELDDAAGAHDSDDAGSSSSSSSSKSRSKNVTSRRKQKSKSSSKVTRHDAVEKENDNRAASADDDEDAFLQLPLKKKSKKRMTTSAAAAKSSKRKTADARQSKRKRD